MSTDYAPLLEIANHAIATGAKNLSLLLGVEVEFGAPSTLDHEPDVGEAGGQLVLVKVSFTEGIEGETTLAFTSEEAAQMVELMLTGMEYSEEDILGELGMSALGEAMNQFVAAIGRALGERKGYLVNISTPLVEIIATGEQSLANESPDVVVAWDGTIGPTPGRLYWTMTTDVAHALAPEVGAPAQPPAASPVTAPAAAAPPAAPTPAPPPSAPAPMAMSHAAGASELGRLADVVLDVTVELGRSRIPIKELLALDEGGVIRLGRPVGEPVDLLVNGLATARGEIVVVDGRLGLRVTELIG
ncbi:MAG: FliM/FliN family flagellar motor switch protein [Acidimicrobiia bacterium]